jgi:hypothetical protein
MPKIAAVSKQRHAGKSWKRYISYDFVSKTNIAPLVGAEIAQAVSALPMAFVKTENTFSLVAVLSLIPGTNMFISRKGRWLGRYVPSAFRSYPFQIAKAQDRDDLILCVNEASGLIQDNGGAESFFDNQGQLSRPVKDILHFLSKIEQNREITNRAVLALADLGIIIPWPLTVKEIDQEKPVAGLYRIDETKMNNLSDEQFLTLRKFQALPIAYAQLLSMENIQILARLAKAQEQMSQIPAKKSQDTSFLGDDDIISFG